MVAKRILASCVVATLVWGGVAWAQAPAQPAKVPVKQAQQSAMKARWDSMDKKTRADVIRKWQAKQQLHMKNMSPEAKKKLQAQMRAKKKTAEAAKLKWEKMTPEQKKKMRQVWVAKQQAAQQRRLNSMTPDQLKRYKDAMSKMERMKKVKKR